MPKIQVKPGWLSFDDDAASNFTQTKGGTSNVRQGVSARVIENLSHGINHLLCKNPRPMFGKSMPWAEVDTAGADPLFTWRYNDSVPNGITYRVHIIAAERTVNSNAAFNAVQWASANHYNIAGTTLPFTTSRNDVVGTINRWYDVYEDEYIVTRKAGGGPLNAEIEDGISTFDGKTILAVSVQEEELPRLDTDTHIYVDPSLARKAGPVLTDAPGQLQNVFHRLRTTNLPIVMSWSATSQSANVAPPGNQTGATITNSVYVNPFDQSITTRNSDTPGATYDAQYCGRGSTDFVDNNKVKVICRVKAQADGASGVDANVKFIGPESFAGNETVIPITIGTGLGWFGNADHAVYLDSNVAGTVATVNANKIDVHGKVSNSTTDWLNLYRIRCWIEFS
jgi:hypothetical protein